MAIRLEEDRETCSICTSKHEHRPEHFSEAVGRFGSRRAAFICRVLKPAELAVIADPGDALILARIKRMSYTRLCRFDRLVPIDREHHQLFRVLQMNWLRDEAYLLSTRLGRQPTAKELFIDFMSHQNGLRFRAYFAMKHPRMMRPIDHDL